MKWNEACLSISAAILEILNAWENGVLAFESIQVAALSSSLHAPLRHGARLGLGQNKKDPASGSPCVNLDVPCSHRLSYPLPPRSLREKPTCGAESCGLGPWTPLPHIVAHGGQGRGDRDPSHPFPLLQKITDNIKGKVCSLAVCAVAWLVAHVRMLGLDEREKSLQMIRQLAGPLNSENTLQFYNERSVTQPLPSGPLRVCPKNRPPAPQGSPLCLSPYLFHTRCRPLTLLLPRSCS